MRKQFLILETTQFNQAPPPPQPRPRVAEQAVRDDRLRVERAEIPQARPPHDERYFGYNNEFIVCYSMHDAEEYVDNKLMNNPHHKFVIFESVAFMETVASPTVRKTWDVNGQLVGK